MAMDWQREDGRVAKLVGVSGVERAEWGESPWIVLGRAGLCCVVLGRVSGACVCRFSLHFTLEMYEMMVGIHL